jgi:hypothetical protein
MGMFFFFFVLVLAVDNESPEMSDQIEICSPFHSLLVCHGLLNNKFKSIALTHLYLNSNMNGRRDITEVFKDLIRKRQLVDDQVSSTVTSNSSSPLSDKNNSKLPNKSHPILRQSKNSPFINSCKQVVRELTPNVIQ